LEEQGFSPHDLSPREKVVFCKNRYAGIMAVAFSKFTQHGSLPSINDLKKNYANQGPITDQDIAEFRKRELPELREFLKGTPSQEEFSHTLRGVVSENLSLNKMLAQAWSPYLVLWMFFAAVTAYKIAYNKSETEDF
jgi:hypothetical protein